LKTSPRPYQEEHIGKGYKLLLECGFFALWYKPGRGKTYVVLAINELLMKNNDSDALLIICPKNAVKVWKTQIPQHSELHSDWMIWDNLKAKTESYKRELTNYITKNEYPIFITTCESMSVYNETLVNALNLMYEKRKVFEAIDESAKFKNANSGRTKRLIPLSNKAKFRCILNGTPTPKSIIDIWSQMELLKQGFWKEGPVSVFEYKYTFKVFVKAWDGNKGYPKTITRSDVMGLQGKLDSLNSESFLTDKQKGFRAKLEIEIENYTIALNRIESKMKDVQDQIEPYSFYAERDDSMPPVIHEDPICFELSKEEKAVYKELKKKLTFTTESGELKTLKNKSSLFQKFRQITGGSYDESNQITDLPSKIDAMLDDIETHEENVLVITSYRANIRVISKHLEKIGPTATYFGDTTTEQRDKVVDDAKAGRLRFIVANSESIGLSVDGLQDSFHMMYVYDVPAPPLTWDQIIWRLDRSGQKYPVVVKYFHAEIDGKPTIDERCLMLANDHRDLQSAFENMGEDEFMESV